MTRVVVCGAGPAGVTLAYTLSRRGVDTVLVERHKDLARELRGEWLSQGGQTALKEMGLNQIFNRFPSMKGDVAANVYLNRRLAFTIDGLTEKEAELPILIQQHRFLQAVIDEAGSSTHFRYRDGCFIRNVLFDEGRVAGVEVKTEDGRFEEIRADLVIGTDGRWSQIRRKLGLELPHSINDAYDIVWFKIPPQQGPDFHNQKIGETFLGGGNFVACHPHVDGSVQWCWAVEKRSFGRIKRELDGRWYEPIADLLPPAQAAHIREMAPKANPVVLDVVCNRLQQWNVPGALLLGDSAHPMSPIGGQGINVALRDVVVALNQLTVPLRSGAAPEILDEACASIAPLRLVEIDRLQNLQQRGSKILLQRSSLLRFLIRRMTSVVTLIAGPLMKRGIGTTKEFSTGVTQVHLQNV